MDWFDAGVDGPLIATRAIHFAATAVTAGSLVFRTVVAEPVLRSEQAAAKRLQTQTLRVAWIALAITIASAVIWLLLQAVAISGQSFAEAMTSEVLLTVLNQTQFGLVFEIRIVLEVILAFCLAYDRLPPARWLALAAALGLTAAIAWTGHAGATVGETGILHLTADVLHLIAAAAWLGGLVSLAQLLGDARRKPAHAPFAREVTRRFSVLGIAAVGTLLLTGIVNALILVGSINALFVTGYGQLLMLKIGLFVVMLAFAAVNRLWLTPQLVTAGKSARQPDPLRQLARNSTIEIALGLSIYAIVGVLGTLHPAIHFM
jgi:putative copper resistance protein D